MKVICTQENLLKGISVVGRGAGKDLNLPVLANVLIEAKDGVLKFSATNLEIGMTCVVRGKVEEAGAVTVPAQLFLNYLSNLSNENVTLKEEKGFLGIRCGRYVGKIKGIPSSEFPLIPKTTKESLCDVQGDLLKNALDRVAFAVARDEARPEISGVFLSIRDNKLRLAATDSYRLGEEIIKLEKSVSKETSMIVPAQTMQELSRILDEGSGVVSIHIFENQIKFSFDEIVLVSRLVEGRYPDYLKIIPKEFTTEIELGKDEFLKAIKTTSLFSESEANELKMVVNAGGDKLELSAESGLVGRNTSNVSCGISGKDVEIVFNSKYLIEGLNAISGDKVKLRLLGNAGPGMLKGIEGGHYLYIVMPIKK